MLLRKRQQLVVESSVERTRLEFVKALLRIPFHEKVRRAGLKVVTSNLVDIAVGKQLAGWRSGYASL